MRREVVRAALLLALLLMVQSLRFVMPLPPFISMFAIGAMVNACLLISLEVAGWRLTMLSASIAPVIAYMQQVLPLPILIFPVAAANLAYLAGYAALRRQNVWLGIAVATAAKIILLWASMNLLLASLELPPAAATMLQNMLGASQLVTGLGGGLLCIFLMRRLQQAGRMR
jgi:hypothetical protein